LDRGLRDPNGAMSFLGTSSFMSPLPCTRRPGGGHFPGRRFPALRGVPGAREKRQRRG